MGKLSKRIEQAVRRRAKFVRPQAEDQITLMVSDRERDIFTNSYANILFDLESMLAQIAEQDSEIDAQLLEQGLRAAIRKRPATDRRAIMIAELLGRIPEINEVDEEVFQTAMRVVYTSVNTHSDCEPGERNYLDFVAEWVRGARAASKSRRGGLRLDS